MSWRAWWTMIGMGAALLAAMTVYNLLFPGHAAW